MCQESKGERHNDQNVAAEGEAEKIQVLMGGTRFHNFHSFEDIQMSVSIEACVHYSCTRLGDHLRKNSDLFN